MEFNSVLFLFVFFPLIFISYQFIKDNLKNLWLLLFSMFFYSWTSMKCLAIMLTLTMINYLIGLFLNSKYRKILVILGILVNVMSLGYFKYTNFFIDNINKLFGQQIDALEILVPLGISFIVFKSISYLLDVYWGKVDAEKNIIDFSLFTLFFPQVLSGPIVRYIDMKDELKDRKENIDDIRYGIMRFVIGLAKKIFIANNLGILVDSIWTIPSNELSTIVAWIGMLGYTLQIYYDFSGYSDMAIGLASMFGFHFKENFDYPYLSKSITEFWRRWHISLSSWFKDYIYIPLGGNRTGNVYFNIFVVFLITGIWHGSSWHFVIWGLWNGLFNILEKFISTKGYKIGTGNKFQKIWSWIYTMIVVNIGWVLFRAPGLRSASEYLLSVLNINSNIASGYNYLWYLDGFYIFIFVLGFLFCVPFIKNKYNAIAKQNGTVSLLLENISILLLLIICIIGLVSSSYSSFIYFNF